MSNTEPDRAETGYEKKDANVRVITLTAIVSVAVVIVTIIGLDSFFTATQEEIYQEQVLRTLPVDLIALRQIEDSVLTSYELLDSQNQSYRIPIARAMELLIEESPGTPAPK
jgi:hypothetical protein